MSLYYPPQPSDSQDKKEQLCFETPSYSGRAALCSSLSHAPSAHISSDVHRAWTYGIANDLGGFTAPDGNWYSETRYQATYGLPNYSYDKAGLAFRTRKPSVITEKHWIRLVFSGADVMAPGGPMSFNPVVDYEYTTLTDASNNPLKMSAKAFQYDYNGNVTQTTEYDWELS